MLGQLSNLYGASGFEGRVRAFIKEAVTPYAKELKTDAMGNLIVHKPGAGPKILLTAHMDEVSLLISGITEAGLLAVNTKSIDARTLVSKRVAVGKNDIPGVIGAKAIHQQSAAEFKSALKIQQLYVDIGAKDKADAEGCVEIGDPVHFTTKFTDFGDGLVMGKALDDRIGCSLLLSLCKNDYDCDFYAVFTVQEEVGLRGAAAAVHYVQPQAAIALEATTANDMPKVKGNEWVTRVGEGPALSFLDARTIVQPRMFNALKRSAQEAGIRFQLRQGANGGTDNGAVHIYGKGCFAGGISVPCRYIHSPCSIASKADINDAYTLADAFLRTKKFNEVLTHV